MSLPLPPKSALHAACLASLRERLALAQAGVQAAQESANSETKSSAGDKYETGREMASQERERQAAQLHETQQLLGALQKLSPDLPADTVRLGAAVATSLGVFYVSVAAGRLRTAAGQEFLAVSPSAPLMQALAGLRAGAQTVFNNKQIRVEAIG
ncbi:3-oxoacyl-ACP synthase [Hymenobacter sp. RP-2-7]|uniref:3-oxoacyl-ACP synthase n=1 Tax=Hymenobacter polaris TaxID=2682546 RepID=A0A7Y0FMM6_9BACT|nr:3-oxoacyl-ACP synthase [Hymenobacter polaris]NML65671.1 3-oxoacyl-ACP synthase [Hymenobacter polaris]